MRIGRTALRSCYPFQTLLFGPVKDQLPHDLFVTDQRTGTKLRYYLQSLVKVLPLGLLIILTEQVRSAPTLRSHELRFVRIRHTEIFDFTLLNQVHPVNCLTNSIKDLILTCYLLFKHVENLLQPDGRQAFKEGHRG